LTILLFFHELSFAIPIAILLRGGMVIIGGILSLRRI
jgi:hypothetical protein